MANLSSPVGREAEKMLLQLARTSMEVELKESKTDIPKLQKKILDQYPATQEKRGAFVTLKKRDTSLRGCIGTIEPLYNTAEVVSRMAVSSATHDPRFAPVEAQELALLLIEISLLEAPQPLHSLDELVIGRDGLIVQKGSRKGLLLPQVASERNWDKKTFFDQTLIKAGLSNVQESFDTVQTEFFSSYHFAEGE